eukprot:CAMPEP_0119422726 /NCGR_PEP_ID=MMETSP1335-20130426/28815_1 /TAXON_ID=259385 /ORGANISM="Chrysoculter rhomboideus, Strain RCC1486" /LENGTH=52 /DNA_ID=CAMNT_0007448187 /DNA_START=265 /DNA_END=420 /DNA_ORIENTATION=+
MKGAGTHSSASLPIVSASAFTIAAATTAESRAPLPPRPPRPLQGARGPSAGA